MYSAAPGGVSARPGPGRGGLFCFGAASSGGGPTLPVVPSRANVGRLWRTGGYSGGIAKSEAWRHIERNLSRNRPEDHSSPSLAFLA